MKKIVLMSLILILAGIIGCHAYRVETSKVKNQASTGYQFYPVSVHVGDLKESYRVARFSPPLNLSNLKGEYSLEFSTPEATLLSLYRSMANGEFEKFKQCWNGFDAVRRKHGWKILDKEVYIKNWKRLMTYPRETKWIVEYKGHLIIIDEFHDDTGELIRSVTPFKKIEGRYLGSYALSTPQSDPLLLLFRKSRFDIERGVLKP